jgi:hypothetical protein
MDFQKYESRRLQDSTEKLVVMCTQVIDDFQRQGLRLTLRQLYYQLVTVNAIPNTLKSYKRLGSIVSDARMTGRLPWDALEDRVRQVKRPAEWENISELIESALYSFRLPRLQGQESYPELWCEKDALAGVLAPIAKEYHVPLMINRGYSSSSAMWEAAGRIDERCRDEDGIIISDPVILYLGDMDPSGEDMVRDVSDRLNKFLRGFVDPEEEVDELEDLDDFDRLSPSGWSTDVYGSVEVSVVKVALTQTQIKKFNPPPNPAKVSDSRAATYIEKHGESSWEVDALPPSALQAIVRTALENVLDTTMMQDVLAKEEIEKDRLRKAINVGWSTPQE